MIYTLMHLCLIQALTESARDILMATTTDIAAIQHAAGMEHDALATVTGAGALMVRRWSQSWNEMTLKLIRTLLNAVYFRKVVHSPPRVVASVVF
jgi:DNA-binding transcriptional regulator YiaG